MKKFEVMNKKNVSNFVSTNRGLNLVKQHAPMILKPTLAGFLAVGLWLLLHNAGILLTKESTEIITVSILPIIAIVYGVKAALVLDKVWEEYKKISLAVVQKDERSFLSYRDEQIPIMIHLLLAMLGFFILSIVLVLDYPDRMVAMLSVFIISFVLVLLGLVAIELDDPKRSVWFQKKIPEEWLHKNIDDFFEKEKT